MPLSLVFIVALFSTVSAAPAELLVGLTVEENPPVDKSNNALTITMDSFHLYGSSYGKLGNGLGLDAGYTAVTMAVGITLLDNFGAASCWTMSTWMNRQSTGAGPIMVHGAWPTTPGMFKWEFDASNFPKFTWLDLVSMTSSSAVTSSAWHHLAVTRQASTFKMWLDGAVVATMTSFMHTTNTMQCIIFAGDSDASCHATSSFQSIYVDEISIFTSYVAPSCLFTQSTGGNTMTFYDAVNGGTCASDLCVSPSTSPTPVTSSRSVSTSVTTSVSVTVTVSPSGTPAAATAGALNSVASQTADYTPVQKLTLGLAVGFLLGLILLMLCIVGAVYCYKRRQWRKKAKTEKTASKAAAPIAPKKTKAAKKGKKKKKQASSTATSSESSSASSASSS